MRDSEKQQVFDACGGMRSAAEIMSLLTSLHTKLRRSFPDDPPDSPRLRVTISAPRLGIQVGVGPRQALRAVKLLCARQFITPFKERGVTNSYWIHPEAIARWVQRMPLFELPEAPANVTGTDDIMSLVPVSKCHWYQCHNVTGPSISSYSSFSSSPGVDDETLPDSEETTPPATRQEVGLYSDLKDSEREGIIEACREVGIVREKAEALLISHSRQKINAAFAHLRVRLARGDTISRPFGRFINAFLRSPGEWEHELDLQTGCWVNVAVLVRRAREQAQAKARDRPANVPTCQQPPAPHWLAWEACGQEEREQIKLIVDRQYPELHQRSREPHYAREALRRRNLEIQTRTDSGASQRGDGPPAGPPEGAQGHLEDETHRSR